MCPRSGAIRWGYEFRETPPYRAGKVARYYLVESRLGDVALPISEELGRPEHDEFRWVGYQGARASLAERVRPILELISEQLSDIVGLIARQRVQESTRRE